MKWSLADGKLTITPIGKPVTNIKAIYNEEMTWRNMTVTPSDKRMQISMDKNDMTTNEHVIKAKKSKQETIDDALDRIHENTFAVPHIAKNEILVEQSSKNYPGKYYYRMSRNKNQDYTDYGLDNLGGIHGFYNKHRKYGAQKLYNNFTENGKIGLRMAPEPLKSALYYNVTDINPVERTAVVEYLLPGKACKATLKFDYRWHVDANTLQSTVVEDNSIAEAAAAITQNHARIMEFKKDKRRAKIVKAYEKEAKDEVGTSFYSLQEYNNVKERQQSRLRLQEQTLKDLE